MENSIDLIGAGPLEARYLAFLNTITQLRPHLHRYCARMTGSAMDGEDIVQEALFEAYRKLDKYDDNRPLKPWLFRLAHNRCIDFLRHRGVREEAEATAAAPEAVFPTEPFALGIGRALEHLVSTLPPKERTCVLLKDVFDYTLEEIADLVNSTVGGVKAALNRGRTKLAEASPRLKTTAIWNAELTRVLQLYVERFNHRDWDGVRELISADAQLRVLDAFAGRLADSPYFSNYSRWTVPWKLTVGNVDGEIAAVVLERGADTWTTCGFVRVQLREGKISQIVDYSHCPWVAQLAESLILAHES